MAAAHILPLAAVLTLCLGLQDQPRTPSLLHLAHAGHAVGSYALRQSPGTGGGGGGPHIVIVGSPGAAHVTTHTAGSDSLEELDEELRQHYNQPAGIRYVPNSSHRGTYEGRTLPLRYGLYQPPPGHGYTQTTAFVGHPAPLQAQPLAQVHQAAYRPTPSPSHAHYPSPVPTQYPSPSPTHYPSPSPAHYPSPSPLSHTLATPVVLPGRLPLRYPVAAHSPVFVPLHSAYPGLGQSHAPVYGRSQAYGGEQSEARPQYYQDTQERRPEYPKYTKNYADSQENQQEYSKYNGNHPETQERQQDYSKYPGNYEGTQERRQEYHKYPVNYPDTQERRQEYYQGSGEQGQAYPEYDKSFKYGSDESGAKAASTPYQSYQDEEDTSGEVSSAEKPNPYQYYKAQGGKGVATSYQSVTLETANTAPGYSYHHPQPNPHH